MSAEPLWRANATQTTCGGCRKRFTTENRGSACSGCALAYYCGSSCQRLAWNGHKASCRATQKARVEHRPNGPSQPRDKPNLSVDLGHVVSMTGESVSCAARSALKLGRPDSLERSHFLQFALEYTTPPPERWELSGAKPLGDEREMFHFVEFNVCPNSVLDDRVARLGKTKARVSSADVAATCEQQRSRAGPDASVVYVVFYATRKFGEYIQDATFAYTVTVGHYDSISPLSFAQRQLNPTWEELVIMANSSPIPTSKAEEEHQDKEIVCTDLAMSERTGTLLRFRTSPRQGWVQFQSDTKKEVARMNE